MTTVTKERPNEFQVLSTGEHHMGLNLHAHTFPSVPDDMT